MRDLYHRLELEPTATEEQIAAALEEHPDLQGYSAILLDEERRALYDRVHATLKMIGTLRFRLDLDKSEAWFIRRYPDFAIMPKPILGAAEQDTGEEAAKTASRRKKERRRKRLLFAALAALVVAAAILLVLTFY
jgi:curved DNA-binding protein CbpA